MSCDEKTLVHVTEPARAAKVEAAGYAVPKDAD